MSAALSLDFTVLLSGPFAGESPLWDDRRQCVFFVDMDGNAVHSVRLDGTDHLRWDVPELPASIGLGESGRLVVSQPNRLLVLDPDTGDIDQLCRFPDEPDHNRLNDGRVGPDGCFWVGSMDLRPDKTEVGSLYRVDGRGRAETGLFQQVRVANGLAWTPDGRTMFFSDSRGCWIDRYAFDPASGAMSDPQRIAMMSEATGRPDGAACDSDGHYWSAGVSAGRINVFDADGALLHVIATPVSAPSMPAFCGPELDQLVLTSLVPQAPSPLDGSVLTAPAPRKGTPLARWSDR